MNQLLWDLDEASKQLKKSKWGIRWLVRARRIPFVRIGEGKGKIYFDPSELKNWIESQKIPVRGGGR